jgi:ABC-type multidrug transport system fused ATPase/permease subunit
MVSAFIEVLGVASVGPFLALVADQKLIKSKAPFSWFYTKLSFTSHLKFLLFVGTVMFIFIVFSKVLTMVTTYALLRFGWMRNHSISMRLLRNYLGKPYVYFLSHHSADMMKNLISEVQQVVNGVFVPAIELIAQGAISVLIVALLVFVDPMLAVSVGAGLGGAYAIIYGIIRQRLVRLGRARVTANKARHQVAGDAIGGIKELKLLHRENTYVQKFRKSSEVYARTTVSQQVAGRLPRLVLEAIAFGGIVLVVLYLLRSRGDVASFLPVIGLYAIASVRLLPALQQVFNSMTSIRFNKAALDAIIDDLSKDRNEKPPSFSRERSVPLPFREFFTFRGICFSYPDTKEKLFQDLDLSIRAGSSVGIVGETGSGKSTLVDLILGLLSPDAGFMEVDGLRITEANLQNWQSNLGYVPQQIFLSDDTVAHNIAFALPEEEIDMKEVERAARAAQIHNFIVESLPQGYKTFIGERGIRLSGGQRQRLGIARALYANPELIVFDEATSALDSITEDYVYQAISALAGHKTIIIIAHRLSTIEKCDVIYMLDKGRIVDQGKYDELFLSNPRFRALTKISRK